VRRGRSGRAPLALRYGDVLLLVLALPLFVLADLPLLGYAVLFAAWVAQHAVLAFANSRAQRALAAGDRRLALGIVGGSTLARLWLVTLAVLLVGLLGEREDGLAAAVLAFVLVTVHFGCLAFAKLLYPEAEAK
jgi:hypothetical protein